MNNLNLRRILKQPTLRMADGGQPPPPASSLRGIFNSVKGAFTSTPEETQRAAALADYKARAAAERAAPQPPTPQPTGVARGLDGGGLAAREKVAGLREGGPVGGEGKGDKIPALLEPNEFVVSNAMLKAAPGLRDELHELRETVLADKGMTPAEADAKAVGYSGPSQGEEREPQTQRHALVEGGADRGVHNGGSEGLRGGKPSGLRIRAFDGIETPGPTNAYGKGTINVGPTPEQQMVADARTRAQTRAAGRITPPVVAAPTAPTPVQPASFRAGQAVGKASRAVGGVPGALALGAAAATAPTVMDTPTEEYEKRLDVKPEGSLRQDLMTRGMGAITDFNDAITFGHASKIANYLDGKGYVDNVAAGRSLTPSANPQPQALRTPTPATTIPEYSNEGRNAAPTPSLRDSRDGPPLTPDILAQRKAERDALTQRDIALGNNMQAEREAREAAHSAAVDGMVAHGTAMAEKIDRERELKNAENASTSIVGTREQKAARLAAVAQLRASRDAQAGLRIQQVGENQRTAMTTNANLRGHQISAEASMFGSKLSNQLGRYNALREQGNKDRDFAASRYDADMTNAGKSEEAARGAFKNRFDTTDKDGKVVARPDLEAAAHEEAMRQSNGKWGTQTPAERAGNLSRAFDHIKLISSAREHQNNGVLQKLGIFQKDAPHGRMPGADDLKGATLSELGIGEGLTSMNVSRGDYKLVTKSGKVMHFGRQDLTDDQLGYLERHGVIAGKGK